MLAHLHGFDDVVLLNGYGAQHIRDYFGDGERWGVKIRYCEEDRPLGTAGAVLANLGGLDAAFW